MVDAIGRTAKNRPADAVLVLRAVRIHGEISAPEYDEVDRAKRAKRANGGDGWQLSTRLAIEL